MPNTTTCPDCDSMVSRLAKQCPHCGRPLKAERKPIGCFEGGCLLLLIPFVVAFFVMISPATRGTPEAAKPVAVQPIRRPVAPFKIGECIEFKGTSGKGMMVLLDTEEKFDRWLAGDDSLRRGDDIFTVELGSRGEVLGVGPGRVHVKSLAGNQSGREGWILPDWIRRCPAAEDMARDVVDGFDLAKRREIYKELWRAGSDATRQADQTHPVDRIAVLPNATQLLEEREAIYTRLKTQGIDLVKARYGVSADMVQSIEEEGVREGWPGP